MNDRAQNPDRDRWDRAFYLLANYTRPQIRAMGLDDDMRAKLNAIVTARQSGGLNSPEHYGKSD